LVDEDEEKVHHLPGIGQVEPFKYGNNKWMATDHRAPTKYNKTFHPTKKAAIDHLNNMSWTLAYAKSLRA
jgi:hypothetical protein